MKHIWSAATIIVYSNYGYISCLKRKHRFNKLFEHRRSGDSINLISYKKMKKYKLNYGKFQDETIQGCVDLKKISELEIYKDYLEAKCFDTSLLKNYAIFSTT